MKLNAIRRSSLIKAPSVNSNRSYNLGLPECLRYSITAGIAKWQISSTALQSWIC